MRGNRLGGNDPIPQATLSRSFPRKRESRLSSVWVPAFAETRGNDFSANTRSHSMPKTPDYFIGKTIIITGAASGIGRAASLIFAREGANVVCADINIDGAKETAKQVVAHGGKALALATDVTSRRQVNDMVHRAIETFGSVQFQFNSAGAALRRSKFLDIDDALFDKTFSLNVKGTFFCMQAILPHMQGNGAGVIVNMASMAHRRGWPCSSRHYAAAQAAVVSMTLG